MSFEIDYITDPLAATPEPERPTYELNTQHAAEVVHNLIDYFRKPRNQAVVEAVAAQTQELEDELWALYNAFDINTAVGDQLDLLGKIVGEARQDRLDPEYRTAVRARILVNSSTGTLEDLLAIVLVISPTADIIARELYPAAMLLEVSTFGDSTLPETYRLLKQAKTAGVRLHLIGDGDAGTVGDTPVSEGGDADPIGGVVGDTPVSEGGDGSPAGFLVSSST